MTSPSVTYHNLKASPLLSCYKCRIEPTYEEHRDIHGIRLDVHAMLVKRCKTGFQGCLSGLKPKGKRPSGEKVVVLES